MHVSSQWPRKHPECENLWAERKTKVNQVPVNGPDIMFQCGFSNDKIIWPFQIEDGNIIGDTYRNQLIRKAFPHLQSPCSGFVFQQDGAASHKYTTERDYLNRKDHVYWVGRQEPVDWSARTPDLTPCDFSCEAVSKQRSTLLLYLIYKNYKGESNLSAAG